MNFLGTLTVEEVGVLIGLAGVLVGFVGAFIAFLTLIATRRSERASLASLELARLASERDRLERIPAAKAQLSGDRTNRTVSVTNVGHTNFTIIGIVFKSDSESVAYRYGQVCTSDSKRLPQFLPSGAFLRLYVSDPTLEEIPINVTKSAVLELSTGETVVCDIA